MGARLVMEAPVEAAAAEVLLGANQLHQLITLAVVAGARAVMAGVVEPIQAQLTLIAML